MSGQDALCQDCSDGAFTRSPYGSVSEDLEQGRILPGDIALLVFVSCPRCRHFGNQGACVAMSPAGVDPGLVIAEHGRMQDGLLACGRFERHG